MNRYVIINFTFVLIASLFAASPVRAQRETADTLRQLDIFVSGTDGYQWYAPPAGRW